MSEGATSPDGLNDSVLSSGSADLRLSYKAPSALMSESSLTSPTGSVTPAPAPGAVTSIANVAGHAMAANGALSHTSPARAKMAALKRKLGDTKAVGDAELKHRGQLEVAEGFTRFQIHTKMVTSVVRGVQYTQYAKRKRLIFTEDASTAQKYTYGATGVHERLAIDRSFIEEKAAVQGNAIMASEAAGRMGIVFQRQVNRLEVEAIAEKTMRVSDFGLPPLWHYMTDCVERSCELARKVIVREESAARAEFGAGVPPPSAPVERTAAYLNDVADAAVRGAQGSPVRALRSPQRSQAGYNGDSPPRSRRVTLTSSVADLLAEALASVDSDDAANGRMTLTDAIVDAVIRATAEAQDDGSRLPKSAVDDKNAATSTLLLVVAGREKADQLEAATAQFMQDTKALADSMRAQRELEATTVIAKSEACFAEKRKSFDEMEEEHTRFLQRLRIEAANDAGRRRIAAEWARTNGLGGDDCPPELFVHLALAEHIAFAVNIWSLRLDIADLWLLDRAEASARFAIAAEEAAAIDPVAVCEAHEIGGRGKAVAFERVGRDELAAREEIVRQEVGAIDRLQRTSAGAAVRRSKPEVMRRPLPADTDVEAELGHHEDRARFAIERDQRRELRALCARQVKKWRVMFKVLVERKMVAEDDPIANSLPTAVRTLT